MTNNKFNASFINDVVKPNNRLFINDGYVDKDLLLAAYAKYKTQNLESKKITKEQAESFVISHKEITKSKLR